MTSYVAFLRGINVGGNKKIRMADLQRTFAGAGMKNVRTLLASGNVLFDAPTSSRPALTRKLEQSIAKAFDMQVSVVLRTQRELEKLLKADPFRRIRVTPNTRLFVTFLGEKPHSKLKVPYLSPDKSYRILRLTDSDICSVLTLGPQWSKNLRQMDILEKEFGKRITTRSWSTVKKCCVDLGAK